jgi:hypothetical protein
VSIKLPKELFNYGNKQHKEKPTIIDKSTDNTTTTNKIDKSSQPEKSPTTAKNVINYNTKNNSNNNSTTTEKQETVTEEKVPFVVLRGTKAATLVETKRDTPRQEKHKQSILPSLSFFPLLIFFRKFRDGMGTEITAAIGRNFESLFGSRSHSNGAKGYSRI